MSRLLLPALAGAALAAAAAAQAAPVELLSHRAAYRLSLAEAAAASGLAEVEGALVMEWRAGCEGWISNQRLGFVAGTSEGPGFSYDVRFSSWESLDNTRLRFNVRSFDDGSMTEEFRGQAVLEAPGGPGQVRYTTPERDEIELPAGTLFPTEHVRRLIGAARRGELVVTHEVFDGSGPEGLTRVSAVIGDSKPARPAPGDVGERRWPVSLAYHDLGSADATPNFEIAFELSEGGVLYDVVLDYGDFSLKAELEQLETFPAPSCP
ncbi:MAG TPA: DUF1849 family protein [Geminicoccaceae bacterium]|nr:DUF1849 family protein [Geminicoccaceae bacterium]